MKFNQVNNLLSTLMPGLSLGFHSLQLTDQVWESLERDESLQAMLVWMKDQGLGTDAFSVMVTDDGMTRLATPGIWLLEGEPIALFGFRGGDPIAASLDRLQLVKAEKNLYSVNLDDKEFPILFRLQSICENNELPVILSLAKIKQFAKSLTVSGANDNWVKFRDVIGLGESFLVTVEKTEAKKLTKDGKAYVIWLAYTDEGTFMLSEKQYGYIESIISYRELTNNPESTTPLTILVTQDGMYGDHKVYKLSYPNPD